MPRKTHKKSKAGCQKCKLRKIKCDEVHPSCGNCVKHGVHCDFRDGSPVSSAPPVPSLSRGSTYISSGRYSTTSTPASSSAATTVSRPTDLIPLSSYAPANRSLELKLMHHFTACTAQSLSFAHEQQSAWQKDIPVLAYDAPYLMDAILAVAALHLRTIHPDDQMLVRASHSYMASALSQYSTLLAQGITEHNAEALFSTAAMIAFQASASRRFDSGEKPGSYSVPLAWFHSFQGVKTVVLSSWQWIRTSSRVFPIIKGQAALALDLDQGSKQFFSFLLEDLDEYLEPILEARREETKRAYLHAVAYLNWAHKKPERSRILGFPATVSKRFVDLIGQLDPRALVIIACFFAMTKVVDEIWWLEGVAEREVMGLAELLPLEWVGKMDWPMRIASSVSPMDEDTWGGCWHAEGAPKPEEGFIGDVGSHIDILAQIMNENAPPAPPD